MRQKTWLQNKENRQKWVLFMQTFNPRVDPEVLRLMDEMGVVFRSIHQMGEQSIEEAGLSFAQYQVLMHLFFAEQTGGSNELNPSEMSDRQGVSRNTMSAFIRNLEEKGFVERCLDPNDRRRFNISLTSNGRAIVSQYASDHLETIGQCFSALSHDEQQDLFHLMHKLKAHINALRHMAQETSIVNT